MRWTIRCWLFPHTELKTHLACLRLRQAVRAHRGVGPAGRGAVAAGSLVAASCPAGSVPPVAARSTLLSSPSLLKLDTRKPFGRTSFPSFEIPVCVARYCPVSGCSADHLSLSVNSKSFLDKGTNNSEVCVCVCVCVCVYVMCVRSKQVLRGQVIRYRLDCRARARLEATPSRRLPPRRLPPPPHPSPSPPQLQKEYRVTRK